mgnify:CR=1 FL=1
MNFNLPPDAGKKKRKLYWNFCAALAIIAIIALIVDGNDRGQAPRGEYVGSEYECANGEKIFDPEEVLENDGTEDCSDGSDERTSGSDAPTVCYGLACCGSLIFAFSALSTKNENNRVVVVQQQPQYIPVMQRPIQPRVVTPPVRAAPAGDLYSKAMVEKPNMFAKTKEMWVQEAGNLELARNWEEAAKAYEKAGMYAEAGRIRKEHLEDKQPIVKIGKVGDTILHDSVMISEDNENNI